MMESKILLIFEGFSASKKTSTIKAFSALLAEPHELLAHGYDDRFDILYSDFDRIKYSNPHFLKTSLRISRIGIFINEFMQSKGAEIAIMDRGFLSLYIEAITQGVNLDIVLPFIKNLWLEASQLNIINVQMCTKLEDANELLSRTVHQKIANGEIPSSNKDREINKLKYKLDRNRRHDLILKTNRSLFFWQNVHYVDSDSNELKRAQEVLKLINDRKCAL